MARLEPASARRADAEAHLATERFHAMTVAVVKSISFRMVSILFVGLEFGVFRKAAGLARERPNPEGKVGEDGHCDDRQNHHFRHWSLPLWLNVRIAGGCFALMPTQGRNGFGSLEGRSRIETMRVRAVAS